MTIRSITRRTDVPLRRLAIAVYLGVNAGLILYMQERPGPGNTDWQLWLSVREALASGSYYNAGTTAPFIWSPVAAWLMAGVTFLGYWPWFALHFVALWLLRLEWRLAMLVLVSWAFWVDAIQGNVFTLVFVAGVLAIRGSRQWSIVFLALFVLMPRPIQLPLAMWLLLRDRRLLVPFIAGSAAYVLIFIDELGPWARAILAYDAPGANLSPWTHFGSLWLLAGILLALWLTWRGRLGWAGIVVSPYVLPQYLLMPLLPLPGSQPLDGHPGPWGREMSADRPVVLDESADRSLTNATGSS